ncbi:MAG: hypothetical protein ABIP94_16730 [Planctomycetota bacterium]
MKLIAVLPLLATTLAAQAPQPVPKLPRPPSVGVEKSFEAPPVKNGVPTATDLVAPMEGRAPARTHAAPDKAALQAAANAITSQLADPDFVAFDESPDGTYWAVGGSYKAAFDANGWRFIGKPAPDADTLQPIEFRLTSATVGGAAVTLSTPERVRSDRRVEYRHQHLVEAIDITGGGVEQTFIFDSLPTRGELVLDIAATTALAGENTEHGVLFRGAFDEVSYSPAIAIDANGERIDAPTTFANGYVTIRVPADFVARAALPLRIDPWIHAIQVYPSTNDVGDPDIAWDETAQVWGIVFSRVFGAGDWDCYVQRVQIGNPMVLVGGLTTIDASTVSWQRPRIAALSVYAEFMVVAQVRSGTGLWQVSGRILGNSGVLVTNQFAIGTGSVDSYHPDIGGDATAPPCYFTVVWEYAYSATDHDIYARQVEPTGALRGAGPTYVQTNTTNQTWPSISKSCGGLPKSSQRFAIAYQQTAAAGDQDIYGAMLTWDGVFVSVAGNTTFPIATTFWNDTFPAISSPTVEDITGLRLILTAYERTNTNGGDIAATCFDQAGNLRAGGNISMLENNFVRLPWPQQRPSVDSDGLRFVVGYHELYNNNATLNDWDTYATLVGVNGSSLLIEEVASLASTQQATFNLQLASRYSGTGNPSRNFCTTHDRDPNFASGGFGIDAYSYDALPTGTFTTRNTACGTLGISSSGQAVPGGFLTLSLTSTPYISGFVLGSPINAPVGPCPGCTLGVDGFLSVGQFWSLSVPFSLSVIGAQFSAQGFVFQPSGAPCIGQIQLSNTIDVQVQ